MAVMILGIHTVSSFLLHLALGSEYLLSSVRTEFLERGGPQSLLSRNIDAVAPFWCLKVDFDRSTKTSRSMEI